MARRRWLGMALGLCAGPVVAQAASTGAGQASADSPQSADAVEGVYEAQIREVASALMLAPDGRFYWMFSSGALDLAGAGRWTRADDGTITLDSDPAVTAPRFELVGRSRDDQPGVAVRLVCETGEAHRFLSAIVEYADGERIPHRFDRLEFRTLDDPPRPVAAIQAASGPFDAFSERYPVTPEANVFTFRFTPNDLGRNDFRGQRATIANGVLTMTWRGEALQYRRTASAAGQALPQLPPVPRAAAGAAPIALEVAIGDDIEALQARAGGGLTALPEDHALVANGPVDLRLVYGEHRIDLGRVEGGQRPLVVYDSYGSGVIDGVTFGHQTEPMTLDQALARARALRTWLEQAGFAPTTNAYSFDHAPFTVVGDGPVAADWASAARVLGDEQRAITEMYLYMLRSGDQLATVRLVNARRTEAEECAHSRWSAESGREWRLLVQILRNREPA